MKKAPISSVKSKNLSGLYLLQGFTELASHTCSIECCWIRVAALEWVIRSTPAPKASGAGVRPLKAPRLMAKRSMSLSLTRKASALWTKTKTMILKYLPSPCSRPARSFTTLLDQLMRMHYKISAWLLTWAKTFKLMRIQSKKTSIPKNWVNTFLHFAGWSGTFHCNWSMAMAIQLHLESIWKDHWRCRKVFQTTSRIRTASDAYWHRFSSNENASHLCGHLSINQSCNNYKSCSCNSCVLSLFSKCYNCAKRSCSA